MKKIVFIFPDKHLIDFLKSFLYQYNYLVEGSTDGISGYNKTIQFAPDLLIINKELPSIDLGGFFVKKKVTPAIKNTPVFLIGDFNPKEVVLFKENHVDAFISFPINPIALLERLNIFFKVNTILDLQQTPMLYDLHAKGNILILQVEGNFDTGKLEILNYRLRTFFQSKKIITPKILCIFPSLYPETITKENLEILFGFLKYPELKVNYKNIKILTNNKVLLEQLKNHEIFSQFHRVSSYYDGMQLLNSDLDKNKTVPVEFLKEGCSYIFDMFDDEGDVRIPALSKITFEIKDYLLKTGVNKLTYFSDAKLDEITNKNNEITNSSSITDAMLLQLEFITSASEEVIADNINVSFFNEKIKLFLNKLKGLGVLVVSNNLYEKELIKKTLESYMFIDYLNSNEDIINILEEKKYVLVFLDHTLEKPTALGLLTEIRKIASRRRISVIIIARSMNKTELSKYKDSGTDYVLLSPFSSIKLLNRIFNSIILDRRT